MTEEAQDRIDELEEYVAELEQDVENKQYEIDTLYEDLSDRDDAVADSYQEGYDKALENAVSAVEGLQ